MKFSILGVVYCTEQNTSKDEEMIFDLLLKSILKSIPRAYFICFKINMFYLESSSFKVI